MLYNYLLDNSSQYDNVYYVLKKTFKAQYLPIMFAYSFYFHQRVKKNII